MAIRVERLEDREKPRSPWKGRFYATEAGPEWEGLADLARDCERSHLNKKQAAIIRLRLDEVEWKVIAKDLVLNPRYTESYHRKAFEQLTRWYPRWARDLLECFQNARTKRQGNARVVSTARVTIAEDVRSH